MLDTQFARPLGDAGNPESYAIPARIEVVTGAGSLDIVRNGRPNPVLVEAFKQKARKLESEGACALTSTCGFLASIQTEMEATVSIPVMLSALTLYKQIRAAFPHGPIGILTASAASLGPEILKATMIAREDIILRGMEDCHPFASAILRAKSDQVKDLDQAAIEKDITNKARAMLRERPEIPAFLLECGNLPPYQQAISKATGKPVFSILDGVNAMLGQRPLIQD